MSRDLITVALPVFNNEKTVATTIKSLLLQTYGDFELIIVDDASTDHSVEVVRSFKDKRIKLIRHKKNKHIAKTLNEMIDIANGKYFARIDGDDYCYPNRFEVQLNYMKSHPEIDLVGSEMLVVDRNGKLVGKRGFSNLAPNPYANIYLAHPTFFGKIAFFRKYKYHRPPVTAQDQDLLFRAYQDSKFANVGQILVCYQETLKLKKIIRARVDLIKSRYLAKRINHNLLWLIFNQLFKSFVDAIATCGGLNYKILRHRASFVSDKEIAEWEKVKKLYDIK